MNAADSILYSCPECQRPVKSDDGHNAFGISHFRCAQGHWDGRFPCGPKGHEAGEKLGNGEVRCRFCWWPQKLG